VERWLTYLILGFSALVVAAATSGCKPTNIISVESTAPTDSSPEVDPYPNLVITVFSSLPAATKSFWDLSLQWRVSEPVVLDIEYSTDEGLSWTWMATAAAEDMYDHYFNPQALGLPEGAVQFRLRTGSKISSIGSVFLDDTSPDLTPSSPVFENVCYDPGLPYQIELASATDNSPYPISFTPLTAPGYGFLDCSSVPGFCYFYLTPEDFLLEQNFSFSYVATDAAGNDSSQENVIEFSFIDCGL